MGSRSSCGAVAKVRSRLATLAGVAGAGKDIKALVPFKFELGEAFQFDWRVDLGFCQEDMVLGDSYHRMRVFHLKPSASRAFWLLPFEDKGGTWQGRYGQDLAITRVLEAIGAG